MDNKIKRYDERIQVLEKLLQDKGDNISPKGKKALECDLKLFKKEKMDLIYKQKNKPKTR